jgi:mono/diheme cytochrome c family protein
VLITRYELLSVIALPLGIGFTLQGGLGTAAPAASNHETARVLEVSFADEVAPILNANCITCHGGLPDEEDVREASLDLRTYESVMIGSEYGTVIEAGNADDSILLQLIEDGDMPEEGDLLSPEDIATIRTWIAEGALNN